MEEIDSRAARSEARSQFECRQSAYRVGENGLYLLDEPEAGISPTRQLSFIAAMKQMLEENAQFLIATHSQIILAFPEATILNFREGKIQRVQYDELEHVRLTKEFLNYPERYLRSL